MTDVVREGGGKRRGQPSKLTPEVSAAICKNIAEGMRYEDAARLAGVGPSTFYHWKALGESQKRGRYREFLEALFKAEAEGEQTLLNRLRDASKVPTYWQAAAWILERRYPEKYGKPARLEVSGPGGGPIRTAKDLTDDELAAIIAGASTNGEGNTA